MKITSLTNPIINISNLLLSIIIAFVSSHIIDALIKPSESYGILNTFTANGFSPEQNYAKIIWILIFSVVFYYCISFLSNKRHKFYRILIIVFIPFAIFCTTLMPSIDNYKGNLDPFHHGEQLSPANAFNNGQKLFSEIFILHGAGEDVLLPSLALKLSEPDSGISMYYFITTLFMMISAGLFGVLLSKLFKNTAVFLLVMFWFIFGVYSDFYYIRDILTWVVCLLALYTLSKQAITSSTKIAYVALGAVASFALFYAIDRGFITCAIVVLIGVLSLITRKAGSGKVKFSLPTKQINYTPFFLILCGGLAIQIIGLLLMGLKSYGSFLTITFSEILKYQGLLFNYPISDINQQTFYIWLPIILLPILFIMIINIYRLEWPTRKFSIQIIFASILFFASLLFIRSGYGRSDWGHIAYSTPLLFVTLFFVIQLYYSKFKNLKDTSWLPILAVILVALPLVIFGSVKLTSLMNSSPKLLIDYAKTPSYKNEVWVTPGIQEVANYIKNNSQSSDSIFVFTQQPIYYYLTNRTNPTRFYIPWFIDPQKFELEALASLKQSPPKYVIWEDVHGWDMFDGYTMKERTPMIAKYIADNYKTEIHVGDATLLTK